MTSYGSENKGKLVTIINLWENTWFQGFPVIPQEVLRNSVFHALIDFNKWTQR